MSKVGQAAAAAKVYFDVLDAIATEQKKGYNRPTGVTNA
jgi:hypothetical protein